MEDVKSINRERVLTEIITERDAMIINLFKINTEQQKKIAELEKELKTKKEAANGTS